MERVSSCYQSTTQGIGLGIDDAEAGSELHQEIGRRNHKGVRAGVDEDVEVIVNKAFEDGLKKVLLGWFQVFSLNLRMAMVSTRVRGFLRLVKKVMRSVAATMVLDGSWG